MYKQLYFLEFFREEHVIQQLCRFELNVTTLGTKIDFLQQVGCRDCLDMFNDEPELSIISDSLQIT